MQHTIHVSLAHEGKLTTASSPSDPREGLSGHCLALGSPPAPAGRPSCRGRGGGVPPPPPPQCPAP
jgi:hypothetical protein